MTGEPDHLGTLIRKSLRGLLGTDTILTRMEHTMAKVIDLLNGLVAQETAASAAQATSFHNLQSAIDNLQQAVRDGEVSPEIQAAVDQLSAGFTSLQQAADDADTGFEPAEPSNPDVPAEPTPADPNAPAGNV
jgi:3-oxoacyl-(acyl-carrier-protein) synthase